MSIRVIRTPEGIVACVYETGLDEWPECDCADRAPADKYWICPKCGAEWFPDEPDAQPQPGCE